MRANRISDTSSVLEGALSQAGFDRGSVPWFRGRGRRVFRDAKSEEVSTGVDRAGCSAGA
jgi:hypothetical protein